MPDKLAPQPEQPQKLAVARPTLYIDVALANGQNLSFDVATATELRDELTLALKTLEQIQRPKPPKANRKKPPKKRNRRKG